MSRVSGLYDARHWRAWRASIGRSVDIVYNGGMKPQTAIEPGVLSIFRTFSGLRLFLLLLTLLIQLIGRGWPQPNASYLFTVSLLDAGLLFLYLSLAGTLLPKLRSVYLPVGIVWAALGPILEPHLAYWLRSAGMTETTLMITAWQLVPVLFIPLVVTAWQYSFRHVVLLCIVTALVDFGPLLPLAFQRSAPLFPYPFFAVVFIRTLAFLFVGNMIVGLMKDQREQRRKLTEANTRLAQYASTLEQLTLSRERNRLARELHDILAHTLSGVAVELEAVRALWQVDDDKAQSMLAHSLQATRSGLTETRRALQELRASPLEDLGLALAVRGLAESAASRAGFKLELEIAELSGDYPPAVQQCVYRVAQEALSNAADHSGAHCVRVRLAEREGQLSLVIRDDGRGFDPAVLSGNQFGLLGMRERVEMIGGQYAIHSEAGQGTTISMTYANNGSEFHSTPLRPL